MFVRLYLVPEYNRPQRILDVPADEVVLDLDGEFRSPSTVQYVALQNPNAATDPTQEFVKVCWRERIDDGSNPTFPTPVVEPDPTNGECICLVTCSGIKVPVQTAVVPI